MTAHAPSSKPHKAVVFDLGMVLIHVAYSRSASALAPHCEVGPDVVQRALDQSPLLHAFESGRIPFSSFVSEFRTATGYRGDDATFRALFADIFHPLPEMIDFLGALRAEGVRRISCPTPTRSPPSTWIVPTRSTGSSTATSCPMRWVA